MFEKALVGIQVDCGSHIFAGVATSLVDKHRCRTLRCVSLEADAVDST